MDSNTEVKCSMMFDASMIAADLLYSGEIGTPDPQFIGDGLIDFMNKWDAAFMEHQKYFKEYVRRFLLAKYSRDANSPGRKWYDIESQAVVTELQLYEEYLTAKESCADMQDISFEEFVGNCMTAGNGTLETIFGL